MKNRIFFRFQNFKINFLHEKLIFLVSFFFSSRYGWVLSIPRIQNDFVEFTEISLYIGKFITSASSQITVFIYIYE